MQNLEIAIKISEDSVATLQDDIVKNAELNRELQKELQIAEQYGDQLRNTLGETQPNTLGKQEARFDREEDLQNATNRLWDDLDDITNSD
jgi:hypothetical protein